MILLSRLIKAVPSLADNNVNEKKIISIKVFKPEKQEDDFEPTPINHSEQAQSIIAEAEMEAESIISLARHEAELIRQQLEQDVQSFEIEKENIAAAAHESGYASGYEEGREKGYLEYLEIIESARAVVDSAKNDYRMHVESSDREILEIGLKVAQKILGKTIQENKEEFLPIVKRALKEARDNQEIQLHVHPSHYDYLLSNKEELKILFPREIDLFIYPDDELGESSCIIESVNGRIDASIDSQLEEIKRKLVEMLEGEQE
ncbi:flagellar assembly protein FliH [Bacillus sp. DTU_2020_1000418_1_SI_GHA_SEK_038]|uniref:flagellar assembly protein FliH n=1 Tax=Bacillus sp. DTU_2020_1000418_1_SI_GHA_SEK_038 TaxID=3077585 RepID=UPI0028EDAB0F|nr:flagellar assembly protein FliH [Bacillus sp. DTU_2020_1000418_1_SI_GHA_SEK_038]WNS77173.1 flagellar assembly protein FliH [Bacillus sp. DTU_2020_1000418_1_SI_GHA_SEK_038]